jgi:hypothetical protein
VDGQPAAVGGLVESVAGLVLGRSVHRQDDGRLAEDPEETPREVLRRLREEGRRCYAPPLS